MNVIVTIGGREAIPVRALPYVSYALTPNRIVEGLAADGLILFSPAARPLLGGIRAYYHDGTAPVKIPTDAWARYRRAFEAREADQTFDPEYRDCIKLLPAGAFVWRWDFERVYGEKETHLPGEPENPMMRVAWYEPLIPDDMRAIILEGFEHRLHQPAAESAAPVVEPPQAGHETPTSPGVTVTLPHMTPTLDALFRVMRENWTDYDPKRAPKQASVAADIDNAMGWNPSGDGTPSRNAKVLAAAIKPKDAPEEP